MQNKPTVLILSGFLGSGKTTLLLEVIDHVRESLGDDCRIAIIENEVGSASIDSSVIRGAGYSVTELLSGCVCCTLVGQLVPALDKLTSELGPDVIVLEATGVADPGSIRDAIVDRGGYSVRVATIVDASRWNRIRVALAPMLNPQLEAADVICLNKIDLVSPNMVEQVEADVRVVAADAPVVCASALEAMPASDLQLVIGRLI